MSQKDIDQNRAILQKFKSRPCFATLATNSIKFRMDDADKKGRYIWIDPPWTFSRGWDEITSSDDYSEDTFRTWCRLFDPIRDSLFEDFEEGPDGAITFIFKDDFRIFIPTDFESAEARDADYDHWYAHDSKNRA
jgi:hypothetical protein